jgi:hypothetical protein
MRVARDGLGDAWVAEASGSEAVEVDILSRKEMVVVVTDRLGGSYALFGV